MDGTTNFVCGFPYSAVCIGIMENKVPIIGVVNNPMLNEMYVAVKDKGATLNGTKISTKKTTQLNKAVINTEFGSSREPERIQKVIDSMKAVVMNPCR